MTILGIVTVLRIKTILKNVDYLWYCYYPSDVNHLKDDYHPMVGEYLSDNNQPCPKEGDNSRDSDSVFEMLIVL